MPGRLPFLAVLVSAVLSASLLGQSTGTTTADLRGRVLDVDGRPPADAKVTATNEETGVARTAAAKANGDYAVTLLSPGLYRVKAEAGAAESPVFDHVRLTLGSTTVLELTLGAPLASEVSVLVTAETPLIERSKTDLSQVIDRTKLDLLPNVARNFLSFALTTPRVAEDRGPLSGIAATSGFSVNGQSPRYNNVVVDGVDNNDRATGAVRSTFSQDAVEEYQVITGPYSAELGRTVGGVVNIITRSGTNRFRGSAFYSFRSDALASKDPLTGEKVPLTDHRFGVSAGGPLLKERTFFFAAFERQSTDSANTVTISDADVALIRGQGFTIENGNVGYEVRGSNVVLKLDHEVSPATAASLRGNWSQGRDDNQQGWGGLTARSSGGARDAHDTTGALGVTTVLGAGSSNELRALYSGASYTVDPLDATGGVSVNLQGVASFGTQRFLPTARDYRVLQLFDGFSFELDRAGRMKLKAGVEYDSSRGSVTLPTFFAGQYRFSALPVIPGIAPKGATVRQAFAAGLPSVFIQAFGEPDDSARVQQLSGFLQGDAALTDRLFVRLGIRYDYEDPVDPFPTDSDNIAPRLSATWTPTDGVLVRAGFGRFYGVGATGPMVSVARDGIEVRTQVRALGVGPLSVWPTVPWRLPDRRFASEAQAGGQVVPPFRLRAGDFQSAYSDQASLGAELALSKTLLASVEGVSTRGRHILVARNVNPVTNPTGTPATQRPDPRSGDIFQFESTGNSWYTAGTLGLRTRLGGAYELAAFYTYAKAEDDTIDWLAEFQPQDPLNPKAERAPSVQSPDQKLTVTAAYSTVGKNGLGALLRDWSLGAILDWRNGNHYNITAGFDRNRNGDPLSDRPVGVGRNAGSLGSWLTLDLRVGRTVLVTSELSAEIVAICTNVTDAGNVLQKNGVAFLAPDASNADFGKPTLYGAGRLVQIGARLSFGSGPVAAGMSR